MQGRAGDEKLLLCRAKVAGTKLPVEHLRSIAASSSWHRAVTQALCPACPEGLDTVFRACGRVWHCFFAYFSIRFMTFHFSHIHAARRSTDSEQGLNPGLLGWESARVLTPRPPGIFHLP